MDGLTEITITIIRRFFPQNPEDVGHLLITECGESLPLMQGSSLKTRERIHLAVLKISGGDLPKLLYAIKLAKRDWRDLLISAGFGYDVTAHEHWSKEVLASED